MWCLMLDYVKQRQWLNNKGDGRIQAWGGGKVRGQSRGTIFIIIGKGGRPHRSLSI